MDASMLQRNLGVYPSIQLSDILDFGTFLQCFPVYLGPQQTEQITTAILSSGACSFSGLALPAAVEGSGRVVEGVDSEHPTSPTSQLQIAVLFSCNSTYTLLKFNYGLEEPFSEGIGIQVTIVLIQTPL
ncbi:hypothetical protein STEG23_020382 [Scotinomys teguina]